MITIHHTAVIGVAMSEYIWSMHNAKSYITLAVCRKTPCLSPVRTQNLMPASRSWAMVWGTPSCSLSLIAVAPISSMFCSSSAYSASSNFSRFSSEMLPQQTWPCSSVVNALGRHVQWSMTHLRSRVQSSVQASQPSTKELLQMIPMHMMNREIIPGRKKGFDGVLYNLWPLL